MSEGIELPPLDVTDAERAYAFSLSEEEWLATYAMASPIELVAIRYCRERQLRDALKRIAELESQQAADREWISTSEQYPPFDVEVLVYESRYGKWIDRCKFRSDGVEWVGDGPVSPTHWMRLPEVPKPAAAEGGR